MAAIHAQQESVITKSERNNESTIDTEWLNVTKDSPQDSWHALALHRVAIKYATVVSPRHNRNVCLSCNVHNCTDPQSAQANHEWKMVIVNIHNTCKQMVIVNGASCQRTQTRARAEYRSMHTWTQVLILKNGCEKGASDSEAQRCCTDNTITNPGLDSNQQSHAGRDCVCWLLYSAHTIRCHLLWLRCYRSSPSPPTARNTYTRCQSHAWRSFDPMLMGDRAQDSPVHQRVVCWHPALRKRVEARAYLLGSERALSAPSPAP